MKQNRADGASVAPVAKPATGTTIAVLANLQTRRGDSSWAIFKRLAAAARRA